MRRVERVRSVLLLALLLAVRTAMAAEVPEPALEGLEPRIRELLLERFERVQQHPQDAGAWGSYGTALDAHRQTEAARVAYREARRLAPGEFRWPYYLATSLEFDDPEEAVRWYHMALEIDPEYAPGRIRLAETLEKLGRFEEAREQFERARRLDPTNPLAPFGLGRIALAAGEVDAARELLEQADRLDGSVQAIKATLARAVYLSGDRDRARSLAAAARALPRRTHHRDPVRAAVRAEAVDAESFLERAQTLREVGQLRQALAELEKLLALEPEHAAARLLAATLHDQLGEPAAAEAEARRALAADPQSIGARAVLAGVLYKQRRLAEAAAEAKAVLAVQPDNFHMLLLTALMAAEQGDAETLVSSLEQAWEARTGDRQLRGLLRQMTLQLARSYAEIGDFGAATAGLERVLLLAREDEAGAPMLRALEAELARYRASAGR